MLVDMQDVEALISNAMAAYKLRPNGVFPGYRFGDVEDRSDPCVAEREKLWSVLQQCPTSPLVCPWHGNTFLELFPDNENSRIIYISGTYEPNEFAFLNDVLKPDMTVVDAGTHIGQFTVYMAQRVGPQGRVLAFEPSPREVERLKRNVAINRFDNVSIYPFPLSDRSETVRLTVADSTHSGHNTLGQLAYHSPAPILRIQKGDGTHDWMAAPNGLLLIPITRAREVEVLLYSDYESEYILKNLELLCLDQLDSTSDRWTVGWRILGFLDPMRGMRRRYRGWTIDFWNDPACIRMTLRDGVRFHFKGGNGVFFRHHLNPDWSYTLRMEGSYRRCMGLGTIRLRSMKLDDIVREEAITKIDLLKIDVEGAEFRCLMGAINTLKRDMPLILFEANDLSLQMQGSSIGAVVTLLESLSYRIFVFDQETGGLRLYQKGSELSPNVVAMPPHCCQ